MPQGKTSGEERKTIQMAPRIHGSYKPVDTLGRDNQSLTVQRSVFLKPGPFDLHETYSEREHQNKRRKISGESLSSNVSTNIIDLEKSEAVAGQKSSHTGVSRSVQSQSLNSSRRNGGQFGWVGVEEFRRVEKQMNPRPRHIKREKPGKLSQTKRTSSDVQRSNRHSLNPFMNQSDDSLQLRHTIARVGDNLDSPVYYRDVEEAMPQTQKVGKTIPQVIIYQLTGQGSAVRASAEPQATGRTSSYFTSRNINEERRNLTGSQSHHSMESSRKTRQQAAASRKDPCLKKNGRQLLDVSEDELATVDESPWNIMQQFAKNDSSSVSTRGDIKGTKFGPSKKVKEESSVEKYLVSSIFSKAHYWLRPESGEPWLLHQDHSNGTLTPYDEEGALVHELVLKPQIIQKIQRSPQSEKLVIHKHKESHSRGSTMIFLELHTVDDARLLCSILKENDPTIGLIGLEKAQIDRLFLHNRKLLDSMAQKLVLSGAKSETRPGEIQLLEQQAADTREHENIKEEARNSFYGYRTSYRSDGDDSFTPPKRKTPGDNLVALPKRIRLGGPMKTRSSDTLDINDALPSFKAPPIKSGSFYADRTRSSSKLADRELPFEQTPKSRSPSLERWSIENPNWARDWRGSIAYPHEGKKKSKATVDKQDIERLDEGAFLNDNLINFYLCWLEHHLEQEKPELAEHIYFHNTFFYKSLTQAVRGIRGINYAAVERWTSKVDLLSFDYIIVPVNENTHWYVAIICNAPKLLNLEPKVIESSQSQENDSGSKHIQDEVDMVEKSPLSSSPLNTPKWEHNELKEFEGAGVDVVMEGMSSEEKEEATEGRDSDNEWPNDHLEPKQKTSSLTLHNESENRKVVEVITRVESDLPNSQTAKPTLTKKGKRKSNAPAPRKHDISQPMIITLDSLGLKHYPTCTNLKEYLIAEIKSKKNIDVPPPRSLGMAAVNIPQQTNYSDCGLFLLSYVEEFLKRPDDFVHKILRGQDLHIEFANASDMRNHIREILLKLQKDQFADGEKLKEKRKKKQFAKAESKLEPSPRAKSASPEASESARVFVSPEQSRPDDRDLLAELHQARNNTKQSRAGLPAESRQSKSSNTDPKISMNVDDDSQDTSSTHHGGGNILNSVTMNLAHTFRSQAKDEGQSNASLGVRSNPNAVEALDTLETNRKTLDRMLVNPGRDARSPSPPDTTEEEGKSQLNVPSKETTPVRRKRPRSLSTEREWNKFREPSLEEVVDQNGSIADDPIVVTDSQPKPKEVIDMTNDDYPSDKDIVRPS